MDILQFLKSRHDAIRLSCGQLESAAEGQQRRSEFDNLISVLEAYMGLERDYLYPEIGDLFPGSDSLVAIGSANAAIIDKRLKALVKLWSKGGEEQAGFGVQLVALKAALLKHFEQEEQILMPKLRAAMRTEDREDLGQVFADLESEGLAAGLEQAKAKLTGARKRA